LDYHQKHCGAAAVDYRFGRDDGKILCNLGIHAILSFDSGHPFVEIPHYADFYRAINLQNRWAYASVTGNDLYGSPRQIRMGLRVAL